MANFCGCHLFGSNCPCPKGSQSVGSHISLCVHWMDSGELPFDRRPIWTSPSCRRHVTVIGYERRDSHLWSTERADRPIYQRKKQLPNVRWSSAKCPPNDRVERPKALGEIYVPLARRQFNCSLDDSQWIIGSENKLTKGTLMLGVGPGIHDSRRAVAMNEIIQRVWLEGTLTT